MKQAVRGSVTSCTRTVLPHLLKPAEARCGQYGTTEDPLEETDFPEHQISHYHISKITLITFKYNDKKHHGVHLCNTNTGFGSMNISSEKKIKKSSAFDNFK